MSDRKMMYAFRGWIAFVAFMDLGTAVRSYIEKRSFLSRTINDVQQYIDEEYTTSRILGLYSVLKALALIHCTLYIHYKPIVSMGVCSLILTIILYSTETIYFRAATLNFYVVFPFILNVVTLGGLVYLPIRLKIWDVNVEDEENVTLRLNTKRKRAARKNN
ncbi:unnamed protein product [Acanthoscelides obtectus]|uniref:Uncharacterized protein n=2 Tax=Acanthoscelides obtectus TaxID=200917 RepID=A0A9P0QA80_ACAOB|nr:unnamed protein product [Acanthoscelides obtectus]CAH2015902.1 unnamed protein product [Acanthoscelides obtectus]CAK1677791.1 hypothetical protein AOBTE_LOCUS31560 [Acanthoscelides obtectus]CAK1677802.1 hypothetical protein AOBTE_LOCUS31565 [Acanthoscelides obtectus]